MEQTIKQRTEDWHKQRHGKFTASEIHKLMGVRGLGETGKTYAKEKAIEQLYGKLEERFVSYDMERGIELEPLAFNKFKEIKELDFIDVKECGFFEFNENSGASPDGLVGEDAILEIKCPKPINFFKIVAENIIDKQYMYQMQMQMMATNRNKAYFFNYCIIDGEEFWHEIEVLKDEDIISKIKERIAEAVDIKNEYITKIKTNKKWN